MQISHIPYRFYQYSEAGCTTRNTTPLAVLAEAMECWETKVLVQIAAQQYHAPELAPGGDKADIATVSAGG